jgi:hypothetical protein
MIAPGVERGSRYTAPMPALTLVSAMTLSTAAMAVVSVTVESGKVRRIIVVVQGGGTSLGMSGEKVKTRRCSSSVHRVAIYRRPRDVEAARGRPSIDEP